MIQLKHLEEIKCLNNCLKQSWNESSNPFSKNLIWEQGTQIQFLLIWYGVCILNDYLAYRVFLPRLILSTTSHRTIWWIHGLIETKPTTTLSDYSSHDCNLASSITANYACSTKLRHVRSSHADPPNLYGPENATFHPEVAAMIAEVAAHRQERQQHAKDSRSDRAASTFAANSSSSWTVLRSVSF